jgi:integral membrane protein
MSMFDNRMKQLRAVAWIEGISYIVLLFVAMPMKYFAGAPAMVRTVGMIHGLLFVLFTITAFQAKIEYGWPGRRFWRVFLTAFIPFGMLMLDRATGSSEESLKTP